MCDTFIVAQINNIIWHNSFIAIINNTSEIRSILLVVSAFGLHCISHKGKGRTASLMFCEQVFTLKSVNEQLLSQSVTPPLNKTLQSCSSEMDVAIILRKA